MAHSASYHKAPSNQMESRYKIVLIGETGSGKTSFIEFILNYSDQLEAVGDFDLEKVSSHIGKSLKVVEKKNWESDTRVSKTYTVHLGEFILDIIDTPGFNDTEGDDQEKMNVSNIISKVKEELYVNCVCLVINGANIRLTNGMRKVITEIVSILPPDVLRNIIILFTKTRDQCSLKFDVAVLEQFQLKVPKDFTFVLDNPYSRLENADRTDKRMMKTLKYDFMFSHEVLGDMFAVIKRLKPELTLNFGLFYETVQQIEACFTKIRTSYDNKCELEKVLEVMNSEEPKFDKYIYHKVEVKYSKNKNLICMAAGCYNNCHMDCDCWFTIFTARACKSIKGGKCTNCSHSSGNHSINHIYYHRVRTVLLLPDLESLEKKHEVSLDLSACDKEIKKEVDDLELKLKKFQSLGANCFFSKNAINEVEGMKEEVEKIPAFEFKERINATLDATLEVLQNPLTTKHDDVKFRWACGILGLDPDNITEEEISKVFRKQAQRFHPDKTGEDFTSGLFKYMNHAKDYLKKKFSGKH